MRHYTRRKEVNHMATDDTATCQLATRIPKELHTRLRLFCLQSDRTIMTVVVKALEDLLGKYGKKGK